MCFDCEHWLRLIREPNLGKGASIFDGVNDVNMLVLEHEVKGKVVCENRKAIKVPLAIKR